ncbi:MAG: 6-phosphofructokinase [Flavobacteriales bacterium]|nr:6-phosphofructokinase [Flavobacteriales bacterium]
MSLPPKTIAVFTSGGDSPGMNACIRAVVRTARGQGIRVFGIIRGFQGMIDGDFRELESHDVSNIIQRGGTILKTARSKEFLTKEGRTKAYANLLKHGIDAVIAIGGDGTFAGCKVFNSEFNTPFIGLPGTIDNDLIGTDFTIGYDTAINNVVQVVDKIRDTADSHDRLFIIEVMGKDAGFIALRSGIACGAEAILVPETKTYLDDLIAKLKAGWNRQKSSSIVIVAEGDESGGAYAVAERVKAELPNYDTRVSILGHLQRGGSPTAMDRVLASTLGNEAVTALVQGKHNSALGIVCGRVEFTPFEKAIKHHTSLSPKLLHLAEVLSN